MNREKAAIIISASSDIGSAMGRRWLGMGWRVMGTYRARSQAVSELEALGGKCIPCDLSDRQSVQQACSRLKSLSPPWDVLVLCPGTQEPVGSFGDCDFGEWEESIRVNFSGQMQVLHELLPYRQVHSSGGPCVLFFAGGGTNNAPPNYSAYIVSKIGLIKMCELLDAEVPDTRFIIAGPGWVKTKIHKATLRASSRAGANYDRTLEKLAGNECTPMEKVLDFCDWVVASPKATVSGRNFSVVHDPWGSEALKMKLAGDPDMYKLRRSGNNWRPE